MTRFLVLKIKKFYFHCLHHCVLYTVRRPSKTNLIVFLTRELFSKLIFFSFFGCHLFAIQKWKIIFVRNGNW